MNAFVIMAIVIAMYAIIAVEFFSEFGKEGYYNTTSEDGTTVIPISSITNRGLFYGDEYYGTFARAFYTLWQVDGPI